MTLAGSASTVTQKLQNSQKYFNQDEKEYLKFQHPFFQTFMMFLGEMLCLPLFYFLRRRDKKKYGGLDKIPSYAEAKTKGLKMNPSKFWLIIPALFDMTGSTLLFVSLTMISASVYQMLKGALVFIAAVYSIIFLRRKFYRHHWTAMTIVIMGVIIVGASPIIYPDPKTTDPTEDIR